MKSQDIGFMTLLQGAHYLHHSRKDFFLLFFWILLIFSFHLFHVGYYWIQKGNYLEGFCQCYKPDSGALPGHFVDKVP